MTEEIYKLFKNLEEVAFLEVTEGSALFCIGRPSLRRVNNYLNSHSFELVVPINPGIIFEGEISDIEHTWKCITIGTVRFGVIAFGTEDNFHFRNRDPSIKLSAGAQLYEYRKKNGFKKDAEITTGPVALGCFLSVLEAGIIQVGDKILVT